MKFVFTPDWFLGKDMIIEGFSFLVLFIFSWLCMKNYKLTKKKNFLHLGFGFLLIALAQLASIATKTILYYDTSFTQQIGQMIITYNITKTIDIFYKFGFFFQRLSTLIGFYILYKLPLKKKWTADSYLVLYFIVLICFFSTDVYYIFHLTAFILLTFIIKNYYFIYKKNKYFNTQILLIGFFLLALSELIFIMSQMSMFFVLGNLIELVSYLMLLFLIIRIIKQG